MSRYVTEEERMKWDEQQEWPVHNDLLVSKDKRLYLKVATTNHHHIEIEVTHLYEFFKEMFTTDWESEGQLKGFLAAPELLDANKEEGGEKHEG